MDHSKLPFALFVLLAAIQVSRSEDDSTVKKAALDVSNSIAPSTNLDVSGEEPAERKKQFRRPPTISYQPKGKGSSGIINVIQGMQPEGSIQLPQQPLPMFSQQIMPTIFQSKRPPPIFPTPIIQPLPPVYPPLQPPALIWQPEPPSGGGDDEVPTVRPPYHSDVSVGGGGGGGGGGSGVGGLLGAIENVVPTIFKFLPSLGKILTHLGEFLAPFRDILGRVLQAFPKIWNCLNTIIKCFLQLFPMLLDGLKFLLSSFPNLLKILSKVFGWVGHILNIIPKLFRKGFYFIKNVFQVIRQIKDGIRDLISYFFRFLANLITAPIRFISELITNSILFFLELILGPVRALRFLLHEFFGYFLVAPLRIIHRLIRGFINHFILYPFDTIRKLLHNLFHHVILSPIKTFWNLVRTLFGFQPRPSHFSPIQYLYPTVPSEHSNAPDIPWLLDYWPPKRSGKVGHGHPGDWPPNISGTSPNWLKKTKFPRPGSSPGWPYDLGSSLESPHGPDSSLDWPTGLDSSSQWSSLDTDLPGQNNPTYDSIISDKSPCRLNRESMSFLVKWLCHAQKYLSTCD